MEGVRKFLLNNLSDPQGGDGGGGGGGGAAIDELKGQALHFLKEKVGELLNLLYSLCLALVGKIDQVFPPETRSETFARWIHVALTVVLPVALFLYCCCFPCLSFLFDLCLSFFRLCWSCCCSIFRSLCCCCFRGRVRLMRAPGRGGMVMRRPTFEADPTSYFRDLRANRPLIY